MAINPKCNVVSIVGGKGGVGKSVFAANFTIAAMNESRQPVLLLDLDSKSAGDQNVITGLKPNKSFSDLATGQEALSASNLNSFVMRHQSGFSYLGAVKRPDETLNISADLTTKQLETLSQFFPLIIADLGNDLTPTQLAVLDVSTAILVITTPEVLAINQTIRLINELAQAMVPTDSVQIIINKIGPGALASQSISQTLRRPILGAIPQDDGQISASVQRGVPFLLTGSATPVGAAYLQTARQLISAGLLARLQQQLKMNPSPKRTAMPKASGETAITGTTIRGKQEKPLDPKTQLKLQVHNALIETMDLKKVSTETKGDPVKEEALKMKTKQAITQIVDRLDASLGRDERAQVIIEVLNEALSLGPLEELLADESVTEIMVNGRDRIFVERSGKITLSKVTFTSNQQLRTVIDRILQPIGRQVNESSPYVDARLKDGSRVNIVIDPVAIDGSAVTIRKFAKKPFNAQKYIEYKSMTQSMVDFLRICVEQGLNMIVSGGTGSGKTTLLNVLSGFIPATERVITIEDAAELQLVQEHVVRLETRPANNEGGKPVTIRNLVANALRMRPDRIIVGECRGGEAVDMLTAMNTGHDGSMTTVHANNAREATKRVETLCMMADMGLPIMAIREQIASAVDLIIQISRLSDGSRKIQSITEVVGLQGEVITLQDVFTFREDSFDKNRKIVGQFVASGFIPTFLDEFKRKGIEVPRTLFSNTPQSALPPPPTPNSPNPSGPAGSAGQLLKKTGTGGTR